MGINVVLVKKVENLGEAGDQVSVREGYARNFLLARGLAKLATESAIAEAEAMAVERRKKEEAEMQTAKEAAAKLAGLKLELVRSASKGKLFGSIRPADVVKMLEEKGYAIKKNQLKMEPIKEAGSYEIEVSFHKGVSEKITLKVTDETK